MVASGVTLPPAWMTIDDLRHYAVTRSLFPETTLQRALTIMGFVQADPIRAPARAQDLTLRHRVRGYRAGDLERRYASLDIHEDVFINYGFVTREVQQLMHPRARAARGPTLANRRMQALMAFVEARGAVHPREVDEHFSHGIVTNYWGGSSRATTHLLDLLHYRGLLRVVRREAGIRIYAPHEHALTARDVVTRRANLDALVDVAVNLYAPLPAPSLAFLVRRLRYATPQWRGEIGRALQRAKARLARVRVDGLDWYFGPQDDPLAARPRPDVVRLLAPFDPVVWDRRRFELLWGWAYRFEAYTPVSKRLRGYYALPLLWRDRVIGWGNLSVKQGALDAECGYVSSKPPAGRTFKRELDAELDRIRTFLRLEAR
jgi:uncharacterized protein YcaQ